MCIHCDRPGDIMPASLQLKANGEDFYCMACEVDDSTAKHVMHEQDGECQVLAATGDTYYVAPVSGHRPFHVNACEVEPV